MLIMSQSKNKKPKLPNGLNLLIAFVMLIPNVREHTSIFDKRPKI